MSYDAWLNHPYEQTQEAEEDYLAYCENYGADPDDPDSYDDYLAFREYEDRISGPNEYAELHERGL